MKDEKQNDLEPKQKLELEDLPVEESKQEEVKGGDWLMSPAGS
jgi:hypothetical protein